MDIQTNPELIINDLLEQIKQLTLQGAMLRSALLESQQREKAREDSNGPYGQRS